MVVNWVLVIQILNFHFQKVYFLRAQTWNLNIIQLFVIYLGNTLHGMLLKAPLAVTEASSYKWLLKLDLHFFKIIKHISELICANLQARDPELSLPRIHTDHGVPNSFLQFLIIPTSSVTWVFHYSFQRNSCLCKQLHLLMKLELGLHVTACTK